VGAGFVLLATVAVLGLLHRDSGRPDATTTPSPAGSSESEPGSLAGRPGGESVIAPAATETVAGAPETGALSAPGLFETRVRMERTAGVGTERVEISEIHVRGMTRTGTELDRPLVVAPGWIVNVTTSDPRVPVPKFHLVVPDPVPKELVLRVPSRDDPAIQTLSLEVVDAATGQPLGDAVFEFEDSAVPPLRSDQDGRIQLRPVSDLFGQPASGLVRWLLESGTLHAPGHLAFVPRSSLWGGRPEGVPAISLTDLEGTLRSPVVRVPLQPIPPSESERRLRLRLADGSPATGLLVSILRPFPCSAWPGPGIRLQDLTEGIRWLDASGELSFPMQSAVGLDVWQAGQPLVSFLLHVDGWPSTGPRELRLPPLADVAVEIDEAPDSEDGSWRDADDWLGVNKSPVGGPVHPVEADPEAPVGLRARSLCIAAGLASVGGPLEPRRGTLRFSLPGGAKRTLSLSYGGDQRRLDVAPERPGPLRIQTRWADLPRR
jgi:hypothetical protein